MTNNVKILANGMIEKTTVEIMPRYTFTTLDAPFQDVLCELTEDPYVKMSMLSRRFECLNTVDFVENYESPTGNKQKDLKLWQEKNPDWTVGFLMATEHGTTHFYFNETGDKQCQFDSYIVGFIAFHKDFGDKEQYCNKLSDCYNGFLITMYVKDNLDESEPNTIGFIGFASDTDEEKVERFKSAFETELGNVPMTDDEILKVINETDE